MVAVERKECSKCRESKPVTDFSPMASCKGGRRGTCKACATKFTKSWQRQRASTLLGKMKQVIVACRWRAKEQGVDFDLTAEFLAELYAMQDGKCAMSGLPFRLEVSAHFRYQPYYPSLDRVVPADGYQRHNVRFVLLSLNIAKNEWQMEELAPIWTAALRQYRKSAKSASAPTSEDSACGAASEAGSTGTRVG